MASNPGNARLGRTRAIALAFAVLFALASGFVRAQQGDVRVQLGASSITIQESVRLAIVATGVDGELDTEALEREFDVIGRSTSSDVRILNGERRSTVTWVLELMPREVGVFTVPAVSVGGVESELLTLTVTEAPTGANRDVFVEASVDTPDPWVQSQVTLTLKVFLAIEIADGALGEPSGEGLEVRALGNDRRYEVERDGRRYAVNERRFALFPQRSGTLEIEPVTLSVTVPTDPGRVRGFFSPTRKLVRRSATIPLSVRPRPGGSGGWWLPATDVALEETWRDGAGGDPLEGGGEVRVGEPLTRTLVLRAGGVLDTQLPDLPVPDVEGLAVYADDPERENAVVDDALAATRTVSLAIIPERAGTFELPAVTLDWFDVDAGRTRTASLPARTLTVRPGGGGGSATDPPATAIAPPTDGAAPDDRTREDLSSADANDSAFVPPAGVEVGAGGGGIADPDGDAFGNGGSARWRLLAIAAIVGWALTGVALLRARRARDLAAHGGRDGSATRRNAERGDVREARSRVEAALRDGDRRALARAVLGRAALRWPDEPPRSLAALVRRLPPDPPAGPRLAAELRALDASLYGRANAARADGPVADVELPALLERALAGAGAAGDRAVDPSRTGSAGLPPL